MGGARPNLRWRDGGSGDNDGKGDGLSGAPCRQKVGGGGYSEDVENAVFTT